MQTFIKYLLMQVNQYTYEQFFFNLYFETEFL